MIEGFDEIVGIRFGSVILISQPAIDRLRQERSYCQLISRAEFKFMADCDVGYKWKKIAEEAPILFKLESKIDIPDRNPNPITMKVF